MRIEAQKDAGKIRYGWLEAGDGNEYMVARAGFGSRGLAMTKLMSEISSLVKAGDVEAYFGKIGELFRLSMSPFYLDSTVDALIEGDHFGWSEYGKLISLINSDDLIDQEKKSSSEKI